jgi:thioredoxin-like negative regulator of GroEL
VRVDIATYPQLAARFKIRVIPTLPLFNHGLPIEFIIGTIPIRFVIETLSKTPGVCYKHKSRGVENR